jgi:opacity protein-like surface antigen
MSHNTSPRRLARKPVLLATVSLIALAVASSDLRAQSAQSPPPAASAPQGQWSSWSEAGLTGHPATDPAIGLPPLGPFANLTPGAGWEGALGFDYHLAQCGASAAPLLAKANPAPCLSPYHVFGQFRYGQNNGGSDPFSRTNIPLTLFTSSGLPTPAVVNSATGSATLNKESHWLVDLGVGRDFGLGSGNVQAQLGIRVAEITSTANGAGTLQGVALGSPIAGTFSFQSRSQFLGIGPRLGVDGSQPLGGSWAFEYLLGGAVLFGNRSLNASQTLFATLPTPTVLSSLTALSASNTAGILNLDAQAGLSYWLTANFKLTVSYRFDGYWGALTIVEPNGAPGQQDRFYYGPMLRGTISFN